MLPRTPGPVLVIGAGGQVGAALLARLGDRGRGTWRTPPPGGHGAAFDLAGGGGGSATVVEDLVGGTTAVCIAAGMTWVDGCEDRPEEAFRVNRDGPAAVAGAARAAGARTVYFSTDYVFDGRAGPYGEDDDVHPLSVYGRSKWEGERAVLDADPSALVLRTTVVWGPDANARNFACQLAARLGAGQPMQVPGDQVSSPTYNGDLAAATLALVDDGVEGVVNVAGPETMDRAAFARRLALGMGLDPGLVRPTPTEALGSRAHRPLRAGLRIDRLRRLLPDLGMRTVEGGVRTWEDDHDPPWAPARRPGPSKSVH